MSEDSKTVSGLSVRHVLSSQWFFKVDGDSAKILYCRARLEQLNTLLLSILWHNLFKTHIYVIHKFQIFFYYLLINFYTNFWNKSSDNLFSLFNHRLFSLRIKLFWLSFPQWLLGTCWDLTYLQYFDIFLLQDLRSG